MDEEKLIDSGVPAVIITEVVGIGGAVTLCFLPGQPVGNPGSGTVGGIVDGADLIRIIVVEIRQDQLGAVFRRKVHGDIPLGIVAIHIQGGVEAHLCLDEFRRSQHGDSGAGGGLHLNRLRQVIAAQGIQVSEGQLLVFLQGHGVGDAVGDGKGLPFQLVRPGRQNPLFVAEQH